MAKLAESKITAQHQTSIPSAVRARLNAPAGATLEWEELDDGRIVVRLAGRISWQEVRRRVRQRAGAPGGALTSAAMDAAIMKAVSEDDARTRRR